MKEGYIEKEKRNKILLITDDCRFPSGCGNIAKELILNTAHHYNWVQIAGALEHSQAGQRLDLSAEINKLQNLEDSSVIIYPTNGYGNQDQLRQIIKLEKDIKSILLITDPRYFDWLFRMESEIRKSGISIQYLNIWDENYFTPLYNAEFYESCDGLWSINMATHKTNQICLTHKDREFTTLK